MLMGVSFALLARFMEIGFYTLAGGVVIFASYSSLPSTTVIHTLAVPVGSVFESGLPLPNSPSTM